MKYTVSELNRMRMAIRGMYPSGVSYYEHERAADIERRLTTYMLNETTAEELEQERNSIVEAAAEYQRKVTRILNARHPPRKPSMTLAQYDEERARYDRNHMR